MAPYIGPNQRERIMSDIAGAFADAMERSDDKDRLTVLQGRVEGIVESYLVVEPQIEGEEPR